MDKAMGTSAGHSASHPDHSFLMNLGIHPASPNGRRQVLKRKGTLAQCPSALDDPSYPGLPALAAAVTH